jgi:predicted RNA-binding protein
MAKNRKGFEEFVYKLIFEITQSKENVQMYKDKFSKLNDKQFDELIERYRTREEFLCVEVPNFSTSRLDVVRNFEIAKKLGHEFFQRIWITTPGAEGEEPIEYLTPVKYAVMRMNYRRASQLLTKKISIPENNNKVDILTGQPVSESKGASMSKIESEILQSMDMDNCVLELIKYRGGDKNGFNAMNAMIDRFGRASIETLKNYSSGVESTKTLSTLFTAAHLENNLYGSN